MEGLNIPISHNLQKYSSTPYVSKMDSSSATSQPSECRRGMDCSGIALWVTSACNYLGYLCELARRDPTNRGTFRVNGVCSALQVSHKQQDTWQSRPWRRRSRQELGDPKSRLYSGMGVSWQSYSLVRFALGEVEHVSNCLYSWSLGINGKNYGDEWAKARRVGSRDSSVRKNPKARSLKD